MIPLSILDLAPIAEGHSVADSFRQSLRMAQRAEVEGFQRFWLAEHHGMSNVASSSPAVLLSHLGAATHTIRLGAGGVMLPNHSPLIVAEQFGTLAELYPDRIDLGLGRAPGTDMNTARALRRNMDAAVDQYPEDVQTLRRYLAQPVENQKVLAVPGCNTQVPIWMLGSSLYSAQLAASFGLPYSFASHFAPDQLLQALSLYRRHYQASIENPSPYAMAGVMAVVADSDEEAAYLFTSVQQQFINLRRGKNVPFAPPVTAMSGLWTELEKQMVNHTLQYAFVGSKASVKFQMKSFVDKTGIDELIVSIPIFDAEKRLNCVSLLAQIRDELAG
ncbi:LLM class flavin-dependent oxidoreductase [Marinomonas pollencensis]|uniref:Luciferase-like monooxygenase n=1 Tax=Marinomonas pollencensis TaxID=491954 RepID=A0A3E0DVG9_9GAMM|nr:LLM class flavin-dependent oxidoreductase [Marinomonas pollencensis]REG86524.1 luciferase family oxidoreductase group 1 [Marinomonas pollencensis]